MPTPDDARVGHLAVAHRFITKAELEHCRHLQRSGGQRTLLEVMLEAKVLSRGQAEQLVRLANDDPEAPPPPEAARHVPIAVRPISADDLSAPLVPPVARETAEDEADETILGPLDDPQEARSPDPLPVQPLDANGSSDMSESVLPLDLRLASEERGERFPGEDTETGDPDFEEEGEPNDTVVRELQLLMSEAAGEDHLIGRTFAGCELIARLGTGGMGAVYKAHHRLLDKFVAIKILSPQAADSVDSIERFLREARSAAQLDHPNLVRIHDVGEAHEHYFISMEHVEGQDLEQWFRDHGGEPTSIADVLYIAKEVCKALIVAHERGIVHRDIKPGNILLSGGRVKVTDFGLAKVEDPGLNEATGLTISGEVLGSPYFMAPEQATAEQVDARTDLYSLGATLYYLLTGRHAYTGDNPLAIMMKHGSEPLIPPRALRTELPEEIDRLVQVLMSKRKDKRPENARALLATLEAIELSEVSQLEQLGVAAYVPPVPELTQPSRSPAGTQRIKLPSSSERARPHTAKLIVRKPVSSALPVIPRSEANPQLSEQQAEKVAETVPAVRRMIAEGALDQAAETMQRALATLPAHDDLLAVQRELDMARAEQAAARAKQHLAAQRIGPASEALEQASQLAPDLEVLAPLRQQLRAQLSPLDEKVRQADELFAEGKVSEALHSLEGVLATYAEHEAAQQLKRKLTMRKQVADNAVSRASEALKGRQLDKAETTIQTGLDSIPGHPQLHKLKEKLTSLREQQEKLLDKARKLAQKRRPSAARKVLEGGFSQPRNEPKAKPIYDKIAAALRTKEAELADAKKRHAKEDYRAAYAAYRRALELDKECEESAAAIEKLGARVEKIELRVAKANKLADAGELNEAREIWQAVLDELAPGDQDVLSRMGAAAERSRKADRLLATGKKSLERKDFAGAIQAYESVLELGLNRKQAQTGLDEAKRGLKRRRRRRRLLATFTLFLLLLGGFAAGTVYVQTEEAQQYEQARQALAQVAPLADPEEALELAAQARQQVEALRQAPWSEWREPLAVTELGITAAQLKALERELEAVTALAEARSLELAGQWDEARVGYEALAEGGTPHLERLEATRLTAEHDAYLEQLRTLLTRWENEVALPQVAKAPAHLQEAQQLGQQILAHYREMQQLAERFEAHRGAAGGTGETSESEEQPDWPRPNRLPSEERAFVESLETELERVQEFAAAYSAVEDWSWPSWRRRLANREAFDESSWSQWIERPLRIAEQSAWQDQYAEVLKPLHALQAVLPLAALHHEAWQGYEAGWAALQQGSRPARGALRQALEHWQRCAERMDALREQAALVSEAPELLDSPALGFVEALHRSCEPVLEQLGGESSSPGGGGVLARLRALQQVDTQAPLWLASENPGAEDRVAFVEREPLRQEAFQRFAEEAYDDLSLWPEYLERFAAMSASFQRERIREGQPKPALDEPGETVLGLSWYQAMAYVRWRQQQGEPLAPRLPTSTQLLAWYEAGLSVPPTTLGGNLGEWCGDDAPEEGHAWQLLHTGNAEGGTVARPVPRRSSEHTALRLVYDLEARPLEPPRVE